MVGGEPLASPLASVAVLGALLVGVARQAPLAPVTPVTLPTAESPSAMMMTICELGNPLRIYSVTILASQKINFLGDFSFSEWNIVLVARARSI